MGAEGPSFAGEEMILYFEKDPHKSLFELLEEKGIRADSIEIVHERPELPDVSLLKEYAEEAPEPITIPYQKVGRFEPCPCASGKKFKNCCFTR